MLVPSDDDAVADTMNISLMLSHTPVEIDFDHLKGEILSIDSAAGTLMVASDAGDVCVNTDADTKIFEIIVSDDNVESVPVTLDDLAAGSKVGMTGTMSDCFAAKLIIAEGQASTD